MTEREVMTLIAGWQNGESKSIRVLMELAYLKIKEYAKINYRNLPDDVNTAFLSLSVTDVAHDTYEKLLASETQLPIDTLRQFYSYLNSAVRNHFIDHYRKQVKTKFRNIDKTSLDSPKAIQQQVCMNEDVFMLWNLNEYIDKFADEFPRQAEALELRYFAHKSNKEIARLLNVSLRTVENDLRFAKCWLKTKLS